MRRLQNVHCFVRKLFGTSLRAARLGFTGHESTICKVLSLPASDFFGSVAWDLLNFGSLTWYDRIFSPESKNSCNQVVEKNRETLLCALWIQNKNIVIVYNSIFKTFCQNMIWSSSILFSRQTCGNSLVWSLKPMFIEALGGCRCFYLNFSFLVYSQFPTRERSHTFSLSVLHTDLIFDRHVLCPYRPKKSGMLDIFFFSFFFHDYGNEMYFHKKKICHNTKKILRHIDFVFLAQSDTSTEPKKTLKTAKMLIFQNGSRIKCRMVYYGKI